MKINHIGGPYGINPYRQQLNKIQQQEQTAKKQADQVEISAAAKDLQKLSAMEKERAAKVEKIRSQVESGTYKIDPRQIAEKMVAYYKSKSKS